MARTMLNDNYTPKHFGVEAVSTVCYLRNKFYIRPILKKIPYEIWKGPKPNIAYFHPFGCQCFILNTKHHLGKFDSKCDNGRLLGYSQTSKAYRVYNFRTLAMEEAIQIRFNDTKPDTKISELDESIADLRLGDGIGPSTSTYQPIEVDVSNQALDHPQEKENQLDESSERII